MPAGSQVLSKRLEDVTVGVSPLRLGTQGWSYKDWVGVFYPPGMRPQEYLAFYSRVFDTVEIDTTFYGPPRSETVRSWMESTPGEFVFTAKMPGVITHERRLEGVEADLVEFLTAVEPLGSKLGPILIQLPPSYSVRERGKLEQFFRILPEEFEYAVEFRHRSWLRPQTLDLLRSYRVSWAITDIHYMPIVIETTAPFTYLRWLGRRSDVARLDRVVIDRSDDLTRWARELDRIGESSIRIYGYMNNHYAGHSPASIGELQRKVSHETTDPQTLWPRQTSLL